MISKLTSLTSYQQQAMTVLYKVAKTKSIELVIQEVDKHLDNAREAHSINTIVGIKIANALTNTIKASFEACKDNDDYLQLLKTAALYFIYSDDEEHDFDSPIGFYDDVEVLNACLQHCSLDSLCIRIEDYNGN